MDRGVNLFSIIRRISSEYVESYNPPRTIKGQMSGCEPVTDYTIHYDPATQIFGFNTGPQAVKTNDKLIARK